MIQNVQQKQMYTLVLWLRELVQNFAMQRTSDGVRTQPNTGQTDILATRQGKDKGYLMKGMMTEVPHKQELVIQ